MSFTIPEEISMIVSSNPINGATNISSDGSYFEVQLQDGLKVPNDALNVNIAVEEATVWWSVPNIITGENDKLYITGPTEADDLKTSVELGYGAGTLLTVGLQKIALVGTNMPTGTFQANTIFVVTSGVLAGNSYPILSVAVDTPTLQEFNIASFDNQPQGINTFSRDIPAGTIQNYVLTIPQGLYDLAGINETMARELEAAGAKIDPEPLITLSPDEATQKVQMRFNYATVSIDFTQPDTPRIILGFDAQVYSPVPTNPILAPNVAAFNQVKK